MLGKMSAGGVCKSPHFPLNIQVLGLVRRRFLVTWKKGIYQFYLLLINRSWPCYTSHFFGTVAEILEPLPVWGPLFHTKQMQQRKQAEARLVQAGIGAANRASNIPCLLLGEFLCCGDPFPKTACSLFFPPKAFIDGKSEEPFLKLVWIGETQIEWEEQTTP